ncbi:MAG: transcription elongation factor GreB [Gammaproteobacteria bacterium]|nr:transcription elongation factor GreB [Gammaproteobacteria bacterium]MDE2345186.1 transcription elongation factor GreB [Gammaproteobacteria bacterium]
MGRWRPPQAKSSPYITREGYLRLEQELKQLWQRRSEVVQALSAAAAEGDRSENAEYIYRKKQLREMDQRIAYLQKRMPRLQIISGPPPDQRCVFFGAWVTVEDERGRESCYRIVGSDELNPAEGHISVDSPMASALLKRSIDDEVRVRTLEGEMRYVITRVRYLEDT